MNHASFLEKLVGFFLKLLLPQDLFFYLRYRHPRLIALISLPLILIAAFWGGLLLLVPDTIKELVRLSSIGLKNLMLRNLLGYSLCLFGPVILFFVAGKLFRRFWKPSQQMLDYNNSVIAALEAEEQSMEVQEKLQAQHTGFWYCPSCAKPNSTVRSTCWNCNAHRPEDQTVA